MMYRCFLTALMILMPLCGWSEGQFVSLREAEVNLRTGPGTRFPIDWIYQEKHYPVEIIDSYDVWRQIRAIDGTTGWIKKSMLSGARYALLTEETSIYAKPALSARIIGWAQKDVIGRISKCPERSDFCLLTFETGKGWVQKNAFWGLNPNEVID